MKVVADKNQEIFFTSDTHYGHSNICSATTNWAEGNGYTRKFDSLEDMNQTLVDNINNKVGENDILFHLGDFSFGGYDNILEFRNKINCKNIHLVLGNHDHHISRNKGDVKRLFTSVNDYINLDLRRASRIEKNRVDKFRFVMMHFPIASWENMNQGVIHLHGHVHLPPHQRIASGRAMDVGVEGNSLEPIKLEEILDLMEGRGIKKLCLPSDHHEKRI